MTFDLKKIIASKRAFRHALAARDIADKLRMLDALHERALALRSHRSAAPSAHLVQEEGGQYRPKRQANPS
jgi:hypothetical protein